MLSHLISFVFLKLDIAHEVVGYRSKSVFGPWEEPIDIGVTDESREVSASDSQGVSSWRHCQDDVQILSTFVDEVAPPEFFRLWELLLSHLFVKRADETIFLLFREQGWNHTDSQNVVDQFEETFLSDMRVSEQECLRLLKHKLVELSQVFSQIILLVASDQVNGKHIIASCECSELCQ